MSSENMVETELFWNQIMMEHALFIRGLLDPTECELVETADTFAGDYCRLLEEARQQDCRAMNGLTRRTLETTKRYRDFKAAGTRDYRMRYTFHYPPAAGGSRASGSESLSPDSETGRE